MTTFMCAGVQRALEFKSQFDQIFNAQSLFFSNWHLFSTKVGLFFTLIVEVISGLRNFLQVQSNFNFNFLI